MAFYHFRQNNSGGALDINPTKGIGPQIWIEADSPSEANDTAKKIGIYFDGVDAHIDCPCCGDRWYPAGEHDREDSPLITKGNFNWTRDVYVHLKDGTIKVITKSECFPEDKP